MEIAMAKLAACGGEFRVRNCCPKLVEREQGYETLLMRQVGDGLNRLGKEVCKVELMEMMLLAGRIVFLSWK